MKLQETLPWSLFLITLSIALFLQQPISIDAKSTPIDYDFQIFPQRSNTSTAVLEWGNSAVISALDVVVASFGPQPSDDAFFNVDAAPIFAIPVDGIGEKSMQTNEEGLSYPGILDNALATKGNLVVMTNAAGLSAVTMARIAQESGAAALLVVNTDHEAPEGMFQLVPTTKAEKHYAANNIDIPILLTSLPSANLLTAVNDTDGDNGMPARVRLYGAAERPFFEEISREDPVIYLIHQLMTSDECQAMIRSVQNKLTVLDDTTSNLLEHVIPSSDGTQKAVNVEHAWVWLGTLFHTHDRKQINERVEQMTGFPQDQVSDWFFFKFTPDESLYDLRYDSHPFQVPAATITVFLNTVPDGNGGEQVYPTIKDADPIKINPREGMAVIHHNIYSSEENGTSWYDTHAFYGDAPLIGDPTSTVKYIARRYIYQRPLPTSQTIVLPMLSILNGGILPRWVIFVHESLMERFGYAQGIVYFENLCMVGPVCVFCILAFSIRLLFRRKKQVSESEKNQVQSASSDIIEIESGGSKKKKTKKNIQVQSSSSDIIEIESGGSKKKKTKKNIKHRRNKMHAKTN